VYVRALALVRDQAPEGGGVELGAGGIVHPVSVAGW